MCSCSSKKHQYLPHGRDFSKTQSLWKFQLNFMHFFKFFGLTDPPPPREIPKPSWGGGGGSNGYFLEILQYRNIMLQAVIETAAERNPTLLCSQGKPILSFTKFGNIHLTILVLVTSLCYKLNK